MPPPGKKVLKKESKKYIMIPVYLDDFKSMNDIAESAIIAREVQKNPSDAESIIKNIKEERRNLMISHNPQHVATAKKEK